MFGHTARAGRSVWRLATFAALALLVGGTVTAAKAETRVLKFYNLHTKEKGSFSYKSNGRYNNGELKKINWFLRDWRKGEQTQIDPRLLDLIWEAYRQSGSNGLINVVSSYRSPATNSMLRSRSSGVAKKSQHTLGKALDFYIPDVPLAKLREIGLKMQVGGVGYYPKSGSPFVHFDVGNARHWPRMNRKQLMAVFPNGNTVHVPSDGKPLPGYQQALASYKQRRGGSSIQVANAGSGSSGGGKTLLAMLFGDGDESDDEVQSAPAPRAPVKAAAPKVEVASVVPQSRPTRQLPGGVAVPVGDRFDTGAPASAAAPAETEVAALSNAQIPVPTWAPSRAVPAEASDAPAAREDAVSTLVAALEKQASETVASGQMAYAVPTPGNRPQFESILKDAPATATAKVAPARETMEAVQMAAKAPTPRPQIDPKASAPVQALMTTASNTPRRQTTPSRVAAAAAAPAVAGSGKGGRVLNAALLQSAPKPKVLDPQEAIASRFQIGALVSDTDSRTQRLASAEPDAGRLVGNLPRTLFASGFAPATDSGKSDRFSGSAVNFLPMVKLGE